MDRNKEENKIQDEMDRFLNYEMTPEEESEFMNRMEKDGLLKEKVVLRQLVVEAERKKAEEALLYQTRPKSGKSVTPAFYRWAVACLCFLLAGLFFYGRMYRFTTQEAMEACYIPPVWESARSAGFATPEAARINRSMEQWYQEGECDSLYLFYQKLSAEDNLSLLTEKSRIFLGVTFLQQGHVELAYSLAGELQNGPEKEAGDWLLLGCLLRDGKRKEAQALSLRISKQKGMYQDDAQEVYETLNRRKWF